MDYFRTKDGHHWALQGQKTLNQTRSDPSHIVFPPKEYKDKWSFVVELSDRQAQDLLRMSNELMKGMMQNSYDWYRSPLTDAQAREADILEKAKWPYKMHGSVVQMKLKCDRCCYKKWTDMQKPAELCADGSFLVRNDAVLVTFELKGWAGPLGHGVTAQATSVYYIGHRDGGPVTIIDEQMVWPE